MSFYLKESISNQITPIIKRLEAQTKEVLWDANQILALVFYPQQIMHNNLKLSQNNVKMFGVTFEQRVKAYGFGLLLPSGLIGYNVVK